MPNQQTELLNQVGFSLHDEIIKALQEDLKSLAKEQIKTEIAQLSPEEKLKMLQDLQTMKDEQEKAKEKPQEEKQEEPPEVKSLVEKIMGRFKNMVK